MVESLRPLREQEATVWATEINTEALIQWQLYHTRHAGPRIGLSSRHDKGRRRQRQLDDMGRIRRPAKDRKKMGEPFEEREQPLADARAFRCVVSCLNSQQISDNQIPRGIPRQARPTTHLTSSRSL